MGKIDLNKMGLSGKIGPIIAYVTKSGKQVFKRYTVPKDPKTPKQIASRMRFGLANSAASPLNEAIKRGFINRHNAYRKTVSDVLKYAIMGEYPNYSVDYSKIKIAEGELQRLAGVAMTIEEVSATVTFSWDPQLIGSSNSGHSDDQVNIVCLNEEIQKAKSYVNRAKRSDGKAIIDLNKLIGINTACNITNSSDNNISPYNSVGNNTEALHFWLYFTSPDQKQNSDSVYVRSLAR